MGLLVPVGVLFVALGIAGSATACFQNSTFDAEQRAEQPSGQTETQLTKNDESESSAVLAPIAGLLLATGTVFMGIGIGNWKRPTPSIVRPANPWSDQPGKHGDPPKGLV